MRVVVWSAEVSLLVVTSYTMRQACIRLGDLDSFIKLSFF